MAEVLSELAARSGFARQQSASVCQAAWCEAVGKETAAETFLGAVRRGTLEVTVANSTLVQELSYRKQMILEVLTRKAPELEITNLRFRVGAVR